LGKFILRPALRESPSRVFPPTDTIEKPFFGKKRSSRYGRLLIPHLLQYIPISLTIMEKIQGAIESPNGRHDYT